MLPFPVRVPSAICALKVFKENVGVGSALRLASIVRSVSEIFLLFSACVIESIGASAESVPSKVVSVPFIVRCPLTIPSSSVPLPKNCSISAPSSCCKSNLIAQGLSVSGCGNSPVTSKLELPNSNWSLSNVLRLAKSWKSTSKLLIAVSEPLKVRLPRPILSSPLCLHVLRGPSTSIETPVIPM